MEMGGRIKEERKRLGLNQTEFAALAGVQISAQTNYENDKRAPDAAYLAALAAAGVDVLYVLTGAKAGVDLALRPDEAALLDNYRHSPPEAQAALKATSAALAQCPPKKKSA